MSKVNKAIIMAAGKGERMRPLSNSIPKPLIKVNRVPMIESVIEALRENDIHEIYTVVGYLKEQFEYLAEKYPEVTLIENPYYDTCNNISSLYVARKHLENAFVLDGDQVIYNTKVLNPIFTKSGYNAVWTDAYTNEWLMQTDENKKILSCSRTGGKNGWQLFSISRWNKEDAKIIKQALETEFEKNKNTQIYWDDVVMFDYFKAFDLTVYEMKKGDIIEIDSLDELKAIDPSYR